MPQGRLQPWHGAGMLGMLCRHRRENELSSPSRLLSPSLCSNSSIWTNMAFGEMTQPFPTQLRSSFLLSWKPWPCLASGLSSPLGNHPPWRHHGSSVPKPPGASGLRDSVLAPRPWARTTLHTLTGSQPPSLAHLSPRRGEPSTWSCKNPQAWCCCSASPAWSPPSCSCLPPSLLLTAFIQSSRCFSFTLLGITQHPGTQTAPGCHLPSLSAPAQPLLSHPSLLRHSIFSSFSHVLHQETFPRRIPNGSLR